MQLGLTLNEAKVFLTLTERGASTAKTISKTSGVTREFIYQIMPALHKKGLVEEEITSPKMFKAISLKKAYENLLQLKENENKELNKKVKEAHKNGLDVKFQNVEDSRITMVPLGGAAMARMEQEYNKAQKSVDITIPAKKFFPIASFIGEDVKRMMKKNVKTRIITGTQAQEAVKRHPEIFTPNLLLKLSFADFGYIPECPLVEMVLFDREKLMLSTLKEDKVEKMSWLYSNNPFIAEMANNYFEALWTKSEKETKDGWLGVNKRTQK